MRFAFVGEGLTDFKVVKNLFIGFFKDKNLIVNRLLPKEKEPVGWSNVLKYLPTSEFQEGVSNHDYVIIQIDTDKCEEWGEELKQPAKANDPDSLSGFITQVIDVLKAKIGEPFYTDNKDKFIFAVCVGEIECWLLPFNTTAKAQQSKTTGCTKAIETIAGSRGFSIHQKNYQDGKHFDDLSKPMKDNKELIAKYALNPSLKIFVETQLARLTPKDTDATNTAGSTTPQA